MPILAACSLNSEDSRGPVEHGAIAARRPIYRHGEQWRRFAYLACKALGEMFVDSLNAPKDIPGREYRSPDGRHRQHGAPDGTTRMEIMMIPVVRAVLRESKNVRRSVSAGWPPVRPFGQKKDGRGSSTPRPPAATHVAGPCDPALRTLITGPNGRYVVTAGSEGRTRIFDSTTGRLFLEFGNQRAEISRCSVSAETACASSRQKRDQDYSVSLMHKPATVSWN